MMNLLIALLFTTASAGLSESDRSTLSPRNAVPNPGAENAKYGWAVSTGSFSASTSTPIIGSASFVWDAGAASEYISTAFAVPEWLKGQNAVASCQIRCASGTCTHSIQPFVGGSALASAAINSDTVASPRSTVNFIAPTSGTMGLRIFANANEPSIKFDSCIVTRADEWNLSQVSQASQYGTLNYAATLNCTWPNTNTSYTDFPLDSDCPTPTVTGNASAPATKIPGVTFSTLPPGDYLVMVGITTSKAGGPSLVGYRWHDGTSSGGDQFTDSTASSVPATITGRFSYTTAQSNITFRLQGFRTGGTSVQIGNEDNPFQVKVYRFPTSSETAARVDTLPASWSGYHDNTCLWTKSGASFGDYSNDASCTLTQVTNRNFGTVTTLGASQPGITFTPPRIGAYLVMARIGAAGSVNQESYVWQLTDGTTVISDAQLTTKGSAGSNYITPVTMSGVYNAASLSSVTLKVQGFAGSGDNYIVGATARAIEWSIVAIDQSFPSPLLVGSVTSNSSGLERIERATVAEGAVCSASPCTITRQSGSWLSSVTRSGTGTYVMNFAAGIFSGPPACVTHQTNAFVCRSTGTAPTTTTYGLDCRNQAGGADDFRDLSVICMGPR